MSDQRKAERLNKREWTVRDADIGLAERLVIAHHYARGAANTATFLHGMFPASQDGDFWAASCKGVAWWIPPTKGAAMALAGDAWGGVLALSRLAIEPDVPANGCSFLIRRSMGLIDRGRWPFLVSYADRWRGHTGAIYKAAGWREDGQTKPEAVYTLNGRMVARKAGGNTRTHGEMLILGCVFEGRFAKTRFIHVAGVDR